MPHIKGEWAKRGLRLLLEPWQKFIVTTINFGDGTIYRASNFVLTGIKKNWSVLRLRDGSISSYITLGKAQHSVARGGKTTAPEGAEPLPGFQLRYIYFYSAEARARLTVDEVPFSEISKQGAGMYKGEAR